MNTIPWYRSPVFTAGLTAFLVQLATMFDGAFVAELFEGKPGALGRAGAAVLTALVVAVRVVSSAQPLVLTQTKADAVNAAPRQGGFARPMMLALLLATAAVGMTGIHGCSSQPTSAAHQTGLTVLVSAAVAVTVQRDTQDPDVWAKRAAQIRDMARQLQALEQGTVATLPALTTALEPLIARANLSPGERLAANSLTLALAQLVQNRRAGTTEEASIRLVLQTVIDAASVYVPVAPAA